MLDKLSELVLTAIQLFRKHHYLFWPLLFLIPSPTVLKIFDTITCNAFRDSTINKHCTLLYKNEVSKKCRVNKAKVFFFFFKKNICFPNVFAVVSSYSSYPRLFSFLFLSHPFFAALTLVLKSCHAKSRLRCFTKAIIMACNALSCCNLHLLVHRIANYKLQFIF